MPFIAGQFVTLRLPVTINGVTELVAKSYSLINAPGEPELEIFYNIVPNGKLSNALARLQPGDNLEISQPAKGFFVLDEIPAACPSVDDRYRHGTWALPVDPQNRAAVGAFRENCVGTRGSVSQ